jgi:hypothetical protein
MFEPLTRHTLNAALCQLLEASGAGVSSNDVSVVLTSRDPLLFAVNAKQHLRDALSRELVMLTGKAWPLHWEVWILNEAEAQIVAKAAAQR